MTLRFGRPQLSIPGPSVIPDRVLAAMHRPSPNIYEGELIDLTASLFPDLKTVAQTDGFAAIYIGNGHAAWEASISNTLSRGDQILVLVTGRFAQGWGDAMTAMGVNCEFIDFGFETDADPAQLEDRLRADTGHKIKAVAVVQTDTASSIQNDIAALRRAIDGANHPALFMVDCIASLGCDRHEMDAWGVDVMVSGCQKGLMTPAGLGFVFFNDKADKARQSADLITPYWDWVPRSRPDVFYQQFDGTAPTHHLYGLREALDILVHEEGIKAAWARHATFARAVGAAITAWGDGGTVRCNISAPEKRSQAVTTVISNDDTCGRLRKWCEHEAGLTLGIGLGLVDLGIYSNDQVLRIGHMGHLNVPMVMGLLGTIDAGLKSMGIAHGQNALAAASAEIAAHGRQG